MGCSCFIYLFHFRPDFTSQLVHRLAFGIPKFYIAPYDKINHRLVNLSSSCDVKSGLNQTRKEKRNIVNREKTSKVKKENKCFAKGCNFIVPLRKILSTVYKSIIH